MSIVQRGTLIVGLGTTLGCATPAEEFEPIEFLLELAHTHQEVLVELKEALNYSESELFASTGDYEEQNFWSGELDDDSLTRISGVSALRGEGRYLKESDVFRDVFWDLGVEYEGLAIGAELASGTQLLGSSSTRFRWER